LNDSSFKLETPKSHTPVDQIFSYSPLPVIPLSQSNSRVLSPERGIDAFRQLQWTQGLASWACAPNRQASRDFRCGMLLHEGTSGGKSDSLIGKARMRRRDIEQQTPLGSRAWHKAGLRRTPGSRSVDRADHSSAPQFRATTPR